MASCAATSDHFRRPTREGGAGAGNGEVLRIVAVSLFPPEERGLMTYEERASRGRPRRLCRIIVHGGKFAELVKLVSCGLEALMTWLRGELATLAAGPPTPKDGERDKVLVRRVLATLASKATGGSEAAGGRAASMRRRLDPRIEGVLTLLERAYEEEISLEFAARVAHLGKRHFVRLFRYFMGMSFKALVTRLRVQVAAAILVEEPFETVTRIALRTGPWDLSTFERAFRKVMGVSPRQYRERSLPREGA